MPGDPLQPAYVLHTRRFRETSLVVEVLTQAHGRQALLARGALGGRRAQPPRPFVPLLLAWRGRGELPLMTRCEAAGGAAGLDGRALYCGLYVNELVLRLSQRGDPHSALFPAYTACIHDLAEAGQDNAALEPVLRRFELALLDELGMGMQLEHDINGAPVNPRRRYHYRVDAGPEPVSPQHAGGFSGATLLALARHRLDSDQVRSEARRLMRQVLDQRLEGRPLRSRELFV